LQNNNILITKSHRKYKNEEYDIASSLPLMGAPKQWNQDEIKHRCSA